MATSCEELTHWKRLWCWEGLGAGEGDNRGWDGWMASLTRWTWVWVNSGSWWWKRRHGVLRFMGSQRVGHDWATELNWTYIYLFFSNNVFPASMAIPARLFWGHFKRFWKYHREYNGTQILLSMAYHSQTDIIYSSIMSSPHYQLIELKLNLYLCCVVRNYR